MGIRLSRSGYTPDTILRGQMWWADIPKDHCNPHAQHGLRPVVIVSNDTGNAHSPSLLACPLTTQRDKYNFIHPNVMCKGTLSYVQCEQIKVIDKELLGEYIGQVREVEQMYIDKALAVSLDLSHYIDSVKKLKSKLDDREAEIEELEKKVEKLESENQEYKKNADMAQLGIHVKGIIDIIAKTNESPISHVVSTNDKNVEESSNKLSSHGDDQAMQPYKPVRESAIDKFNRRYEKFEELTRQELPSEDDSAPIKTRSKKWTTQTVAEFLADFGNIPTDELLTKYSLSTYATARRYYYNFKKSL